MGIRTKSLLVVSLSMSGLILAIMSFFWLHWRENISRREKSDALHGIQIIQMLLDDDLDQLERIAADWAEWDDTYAFIENENPDYIRSNLVADTYQNLLLNLMVFININGHIVYGDAYDLQNERTIDLPTELENHLTWDGLLTKDESESHSGILMLSGEPMLVAARPILTSEGLGPVRGTFIIGRYIDSAQVNRLSRLTKYEITLTSANAPDLAEDFTRARTDLLRGASLFIQPVNETTLHAYAMLEDLYNKPALIVRLSIPRQEYQQGIINLGFLWVSLGITGMVFILLTLVLLEKFVLARLGSLSAQVIQIGQKADPSQRVTIHGKDELTQLSLVINETLEALQKSRQALIESEGKFRQLVESAPVVIYTAEVTPEGDCIFTTLNPAFEKLTGWRQDEWLGKSVIELILAEDQPRASKKCETVLQGCHVPSEVRINSKTGKWITCEIVSTPLIKEGQVIGELGIIHDITPHKQLEEQMQASILEKETLLKEIHHRVKNNLQVVSSILNLQASRCADEQTRLVFQETQNRVRSMALIHEKLYRSRNSAQVNSEEYICSLVDYLGSIFKSYAPGVEVVVKASDLMLDIDRAVSCGLIITELVTNAFKHAFLPDQSGQIEVNLYTDRSSNIILRVADTGKGFPEDDGFRQKASLGLQLVDILVRQLNGSIEMHRRGGSQFVITFPQKEVNG